MSYAPIYNVAEAGHTAQHPELSNVSEGLKAATALPHRQDLALEDFFYQFSGRGRDVLAQSRIEKLFNIAFTCDQSS